jgi:hypothetical protein
MDISCPNIKIDEHLKPTHLQNNCSILNVWLLSSQKLGLRINNNRSRSSYSPNCYNGHNGHNKPVMCLWALDFLDTRHQETQFHIGHMFSCTIIK